MKVYDINITTPIVTPYITSWLLLWSSGFLIPYVPVKRHQAQRSIEAVYPPVSDVIFIFCVLLFKTAAKVCDGSRFTLHAILCHWGVTCMSLPCRWCVRGCSLTRRWSASLQMFYSPDKNNLFLICVSCFPVTVCACLRARACVRYATFEQETPRRAGWLGTLC